MGLTPPKSIYDLGLLALSGAVVFVPVYLGFSWRYRRAGVAIGSVVGGVSVLLGITFLDWPSFGLHKGFWALAASSIIYTAGSLLFKKRAGVQVNMS